MVENNCKEIKESLHNLESWIDNNGWSGYDPYDILQHPIYVKIKHTRYPRRIFEEIVNNQFALASRKLLGVKKEVFAKAMGLFAISYLKYFQSTQNEQYLDKSKECLDWLITNHSKGYHGICWGYPFDWYTRILIPHSMPSGVVTSFILDSFKAMYKFSNDQKYWDVIENSMQFFLQDLKIDHIADDQLCFTYTPIDDFHVLNANLLTAKQLIYVGSKINNSQYIELGQKAVNYVIANQNEDGSWYYRGTPDRLDYMIDNQHTGFNLECLFDVYQVDPKNYILDSIQKGLQYYKAHFVGDNYETCLYKDTYKHVTINACAEIILCFSRLSSQFPDLLPLAEGIAHWTIQTFQTPKGYFAYKIYGGMKSKMAFIRTGQAWMMRALVEVIEKKNE